MRFSEFASNKSETVMLAPPVSVDDIEAMKLDELIELDSEHELFNMVPKTGVIAMVKGVEPVLFIESNSKWAPLVVVADEASRAETTDLIKTLAVIVLKRRKKDVSGLMPSYEKYLNGAIKFMNRHKIDREEFDDLTSRASMDAINSGKKYNGINFKDRASIFVSAFRPAFSQVANRRADVSGDQVKTLSAIFTLLNNPDSESAYRRLASHITVTGDLKLIPAFRLGTDLTGEKKAIDKALQNIIKKEGTGGKITKEDKDRLREEDPEKLRQINKLKSNLKTRLEHDIREAVLEVTNGKKNWALIEDVISILKKKGHREEDLRIRYKGLMDTRKLIGLSINAFLTDKYGNETTAKAVEPGIVDSTLVVNPDPAGKFAFVWQGKTKNQLANTVKNNWRRTYTKAHHNKSTQAKHETIMQITSGDNFDQAKKRWRKAMTSKSMRDRAFGLITEMLFWTGARIGSGVGNTGGQRTYALMTLEGQHVRVVNNSKIIISYSGKSAQKQAHELNLNRVEDPDDKKYLKILMDYIKERKEKIPSNHVIFASSIEGKTVNPTELNRFLKTVFKNPNFTAHKMRTVLGTQMAIPALEKARNEYKKVEKSLKNAGEKRKAANDIFLKALTPVGEKLGHFYKEQATPTTAITKGYIVSKIMDDYFTDVGQAPTTTIDAALEKGRTAQSK